MCLRFARRARLSHPAALRYGSRRGLSCCETRSPWTNSFGSPASRQLVAVSPLPWDFGSTTRRRRGPRPHAAYPTRLRTPAERACMTALRLLPPRPRSPRCAALWWRWHAQPTTLCPQCALRTACWSTTAEASLSAPKSWCVGCAATACPPGCLADADAVNLTRPVHVLLLHHTVCA